FNRLNDGRVWWNFQGHANEGVLTHEYIYQRDNQTPDNDDKSRYLNDDKPFLFSAFSCHANAFGINVEGQLDKGPSIGESMVEMPKRGAIAPWPSTGYEILPFSSNTHINITWARTMFQDPPHDDFLGSKGARVMIGESTALALARYVPGVVFNPNEKGLAL